MKKTCLPYWMLFLLMLHVVVYASAQAVENVSYRINTVKELHEFFKYSEDRIPLVCGHRGGARKGLPENSIATFERTLQEVPVFLEIDPRLTKDSVVVVLHDATLDRTTTGSGKLSDYTYEELQSFFLKDKQGNVTSYKVHKLEEVIQWARNRTVLMLDKKDVPLPMLYDIIDRNNAESYVIVSVYSVEEAHFYHDLNKDLMLEAFITSEKRLMQYDESGIPWNNIIAYVGQPKNKSLYNKIHQRGSMVMVFTSRVQDKIESKKERQKAYKEIIQNGADILLSDRPVEAVQAVKELSSQHSK